MLTKDQRNGGQDFVLSTLFCTCGKREHGHGVFDRDRRAGVRARR